jgi:hypothetical protein
MQRWRPRTQHGSKITLDRAWRIERGGERLRIRDAHSFAQAGLLMASTSKVSRAASSRVRGEGRSAVLHTVEAVEHCKFDRDALAHDAVLEVIGDAFAIARVGDALCEAERR